MPYWRTYYHLVWATHQRFPLIKPEMEHRLYGLMAETCYTHGGHAYIVNGVADHVHVVAALPPKTAIAEIVSRVKGVSSRFIADEYESPFAWQRGYGVFSVSETSLDRAIDYVRRQKEHHAQGTTFAALERITPDDNGPSFVR